MDFFNWETYISNYPDLKKAGIKTQQQAFLHYTRFGILEKRTDKVKFKLEPVEVEPVKIVVEVEPDKIVVEVEPVKIVVEVEPVKIVVEAEPVVEVEPIVEVEVVGKPIIKPEITFEFTPIDPTVVEMVKKINEKSKRKYNKKK